jgi:hypothetical protein
VEVAGDLGQQASDHELGGEHEERADGEHVDDEREPRPRAAGAGRDGG